VQEAVANSERKGLHLGRVFQLDDVRGSLRFSSLSSESARLFGG
jgi:hypothetical protein